MVRIQPQNAVSWGYLADGELAQDNLKQAKEHFTQAVSLGTDIRLRITATFGSSCSRRELGRGQGNVWIS